MLSPENRQGRCAHGFLSHRSTPTAEAVLRCADAPMPPPPPPTHMPIFAPNHDDASTHTPTKYHGVLSADDGGAGCPTPVCWCRGYLRWDHSESGMLRRATGPPPNRLPLPTSQRQLCRRSTLIVHM